MEGPLALGDNSAGAGVHLDGAIIEAKIARGLLSMAQMRSIA
jgi:hypothetical protein